MEALKQKIKVFFSKVKRPGLFQEQIKLFVNMFFAYATIHQIRSGWSFGSKYMQDDTGLSNQDVGLTNMIFLLFLGIGFEINGQIGDKKSPKHFLSVGMLGASISIILLAFSRMVGSKSVALYCILQAFNGFFESMCFPSFMRILGLWFSQNNRGIVVTCWSGGKNLGDITGSIIGDIMIIRMGLSWNGAMFLFAVMCLISLGFFYSKVVNNPGLKGYSINKRQNQEKINENNENKNEELPQGGNNIQKQLGHENSQQQNHNDINIDFEDKAQQGEQSNKKDDAAEIDAVYGANNQEQISNAQDNIQPQDQGDEKLKTLTIKQALSIPGVPFFILGFMCLKSLNYGLIFWLPKYLQDNGLENISSAIYVIWCIGVFCGGILGGYLGDRFKKRSLLMPPALILLLFFLFCFSQIPLSSSKGGLFMLVAFLMGACQGVPYNIISGPLMIDLGKHPKLKGKAQAVGTIAGLIEGTGSLCASIVQIIIPSIGEKNIFILFMLSTFASFISLTPVSLNDFFAYKKEQKKLKQLKQQQEAQQQQFEQQNQHLHQQQKERDHEQQNNDSNGYRDSQNSDQQFKNYQERNVKSINLHEDQQKNPSLQLNLLQNQFGNDNNFIQNNHQTKNAPANIEMNIFNDNNYNNNNNHNNNNNNNHHVYDFSDNHTNDNNNNNNNHHHHQQHIDKPKPFISPSSVKHQDYDNESDGFGNHNEPSQLHKIANDIQHHQQQQQQQGFSGNLYQHQQQQQVNPQENDNENDNQILDLNQSEDGESNLN